MSLFKLNPKKLKKPVAPGKKISIIHNLKNNKESNMSSLHSLKNCKETPLYASFEKASYTIEAAIILPIFLTMMMFGIFFFRILQIQTGVQESIEMASRSFAVIAKDNSVSKGEVIAYSDLLMSKNEVPKEFISGGLLALNYSGTSTEGDYIDIKVKYNVKFPLDFLGRLSFSVSQEAKSRKWTGFDPSESAWDGVYVYVADYSEVYHSNPDCTYLNPSITPISGSALDSARNKNGGKYYQCKSCSAEAGSGIFYVTDYGTCYHTSINCSSLKRNIRKILLEEAKEKYPPCSKCAGGK